MRFGVPFFRVHAQKEVVGSLFSPFFFETE